MLSGLHNILNLKTWSSRIYLFRHDSKILIINGSHGSEDQDLQTKTKGLLMKDMDFTEKIVSYLI